MAEPTLRSLHVCYASVEDPLIRTQVVAYLEGLARRGHTIHMLSFEPRLGRARRRELQAELGRRGIAWHSLRYHRRPSLPATSWDVAVGAVVSAFLVRRHGLAAIHARSHVPAAIALIALRFRRARLLFDIRGLWGEEYVDAGRWRRGSLPHRLADWVERRAIRRADALVVLTERVREHLFGTGGRERLEVIPCCVDLDRVGRSEPGAIERLRAELELGDRPLMAYTGKLERPYMPGAMADFFVAARRAIPGLGFLVLTQAPPEQIAAELERAGAEPADFRITRADPEELGTYLGMCELAICFCEPTHSRIASSPTKIAEYLAAGLPVVSGPDIGDVDGVLSGGGVGEIVERFDEPAYGRVAERIAALLAEPGIRERCRAVAASSFSLGDVGVPAYDRLYRALAALAGEPQRAKDEIGTHDEDRLRPL